MWKSIFTTTLIAGALDITAACTQAYLSNKVTPDRILKYIASGVWGNTAHSGGSGMMALGLLFHFMIAFACTVCFYFSYQKIGFLSKNVLLNAVLIGIVAWVVTTQIIVPMSQITPRPFNLTNALIAVSILIGCIGLPIALRAKDFFAK